MNRKQEENKIIEHGQVKYEINEGEYKGTKYYYACAIESDKNIIEANIPPFIELDNGQKAVVTSVAKSCFNNHNKLSSVSLPITISELEDNAFEGCKNVKWIHIFERTAWNLARDKDLICEEEGRHPYNHMTILNRYFPDLINKSKGIIDSSKVNVMYRSEEKTERREEKSSTKKVKPTSVKIENGRIVEVTVHTGERRAKKKVEVKATVKDTTDKPPRKVKVTPVPQSTSKRKKVQVTVKGTRRGR